MCPKEGILVAWDDVSISLCLHVCHIVSFVWEPERLHWKTPPEGSRMLRLVAHPCGSHPSQLCRAARRIAGAGLGVGASSSSTACLRKGHQRHPKIQWMIIIYNFFSIFFIAIIQKLPFGHAHLAACGRVERFGFCLMLPRQLEASGQRQVASGTCDGWSSSTMVATLYHLGMSGNEVYRKWQLKCI